MTTVSSADDCKQLVAGNYDVIINECSNAFRQTLTDYLEHFQHHEKQLGQQDCSYVNEFKLLKELSKALKEDKANLQVGELDCNQKKNRYKDIIPFSHTRVILGPEKQLQQKQHLNAYRKADIGVETAESEDGCYINANYVRGPSGQQRAYIACQGPLQCTLNDFWRMIWECNVSVVIMACNEFESGKPKCELYWPEQIDASQTYGNIQVTLSRVRQLNSDFLIRKFSLKLLEPEQESLLSNDGNNNNNKANDNYQCESSPRKESANQQLPPNNQRYNPSPSTSNNSSNTNVSSSNCQNFPAHMQFATSSESINTTSDTSGSTRIGSTQPDTTTTTTRVSINSMKRNRVVLAERTICQFHYTTWPDHGVPDSVSPILELVRLVREVQPTEDRPLLVHCSAGCGRTGTICCIDYVWGLLRMGKLDEDFNLCRIISDMRQQRMAMVQTLEQYILCHRAVALGRDDLLSYSQVMSMPPGCLEGNIKSKSEVASKSVGWA